MVEINKEQFEDFKLYGINYIKGFKVQAYTIADCANYYDESDMVTGKHSFGGEPNIYEIDELLYKKLFVNKFMENVKSAMDFCKVCSKLVFKDVSYCSPMCESKDKGEFTIYINKGE